MNQQPLSELTNLSGKRAIVTGGAVGIGYGISYRLAEAGASVLIADIKITEIPALVVMADLRNLKPM